MPSSSPTCRHGTRLALWHAQDPMQPGRRLQAPAATNKRPKCTNQEHVRVVVEASWPSVGGQLLHHLESVGEGLQEVGQLQLGGLLSVPAVCGRRGAPAQGAAASHSVGTGNAVATDSSLRATHLQPLTQHSHSKQVSACAPRVAELHVGRQGSIMCWSVPCR